MLTFPCKPVWESRLREFDARGKCGESRLAYGSAYTCDNAMNGMWPVQYGELAWQNLTGLRP